MKNLVIVESPTKAKTIAKFLNKDFKITSSYGHLRDLPVKSLGIDIEHDFKPKYVVAKDKKAIVDELKKLAKKADTIYFATDEDREGEAISWHLVYLLGNGKAKINYQRIAFHEITKNAVLDAIKHPRMIDENLVDAQQARRVLDRLVGYKLSPFLWKKVARGLSAGRVQSVAVRLIIEREREIQKFQSQEYWGLDAILGANNKDFIASLNKFGGEKLEKLVIKNKQEMDNILKNLDTAKYVVDKITKKQISKKSPAPFMTSTLQQDAHNKLGFSSRQTMYIAQNLYEGVKIGEEQIGLITYMRTDSLNLSETFLANARDFISQKFGHEYLPEKPVQYKTKAKTAQEAHEAIRPTDASQNPEEIEKYLDDKQYKLYKLIWQRAISCQMKPAILDSTIVDIRARDAVFRSTGSIIKFDGFLKIYHGNTKENILPDMKEKEELQLKKLDPKQHFTEPPARYNDASLIKKMEELGIGRPSTYAPTISTIQARNYIKREAGRFAPQEIAFMVSDLLSEHFPKIVDYQFTANMENNLDEIANGGKKWIPVIEEFYESFNKNLTKKYMEIKKEDITNDETDEKCEKCGASMTIKTGRFGKFLACSKFPACKNTKPLTNKGPANGNKNANDNQVKTESIVTDLKCEKCGASMLIRQGRFGQFYACSAFPKCKNTKALDQDTGVLCPQCNKGKIVIKKTKSKKTFYACDQYPQCRFALWSRPTGKKCEKCGSPIINAGKNEEKCSNKDCGQTNQ
ncbi:type I DNA topoisomerase [Candidatus Kuenenbacteria bacterium CG08_land_8_20_14_0_20_37_23]|uniref:DNA topoisomerase 1 n=1 Tax=Candidatus Kuenenbacteria bacterium CG08_land_8_20_14_0_20_37_23 TaxID=1974617 RepID=A0A2M6XS11_9BACT|nr:MAG: type I DNA topoisomerase [Candidatus Kuenenbacteria bacterium CG08_land_8_20_14_0_20_37_23]